MKLVIDASVTLKWLLENSSNELNVREALEILQGISTGQHEIVQPPHWLAEILAVLARRAPHTVAEALVSLNNLHGMVAIDDAIYRHASELASRLNHHLFDTLYHAVALERDATLITADERYFRVASGEGAITRLGDFTQD